MLILFGFISGSVWYRACIRLIWIDLAARLGRSAAEIEASFAQPVSAPSLHESLMSYETDYENAKQSTAELTGMLYLCEGCAHLCADQEVLMRTDPKLEKFLVMRHPVIVCIVRLFVKLKYRRGLGCKWSSTALTTMSNCILMITSEISESHIRVRIVNTEIAPFCRE